MLGGLGADVIAGDNAVITTGGYVKGRTVTLLDIGNDGVGGADTIEGDADSDAIFGQTGDDVIWGDQGLAGPYEGNGAADYIEGNDGNDTIRGEAGGDDIVGGGSADDGVIDADRIGTGLDDEGETSLEGGPGRDWIAGDNARFDRVLGNGLDYPDPGVTPIQLFDLGTTAAAAAPGAYGGDSISGGDDVDLIFGQGGDDTATGGDAGDYIEGNDGDDTITGGEGSDALIGGGSASDGLIVQGRLGAGLLDGGETNISGGLGRDSIAGDNARMNRVLFQGPDYPNPAVDPIVLFDLQATGVPVDAATHGRDTASGGDDTDLMFGQGDDDTLDGDDGADYIEGNDGNDTIRGGSGDDDLIGGGSADDGVIDPVRVGNGLHDEGETLIAGNAGIDWIMGDNAFSNRVLFNDAVTPITLFDVNSTDVDVSGGDVIDGGTEDDLIFGQGNGSQGDQSDPGDGVDNDGDGAVDEDAAGWLGDTISGSDGNDYIEGNHGADLIFGNDGRDDMIGGGSAIDGVIDADRIGDGLTDARDTLWGGGDDDVIAGDNARILAAEEGPLWLDNARDVRLFDVNSTDPALSGGDFIAGNDGDDVGFGQGNGAQPVGQADPIDGVDNDFDGRESGSSTEYDCADAFDNDGNGLVDAAAPGCSSAIDEDTNWMGDIMFGDLGEDYLEGNHGSDWMFGGDDEDDLIGGGSANDGIIDADRDPAGLFDRADIIHGNDDDDVITGDNAAINRVDGGADWVRISSANLGGPAAAGYGEVDQAVRVTDMFAGDSGPLTHGNDYLVGDAANDEMYGQLGDDFVLGSAGDDVLVGDLGQVTANLIGDDAADPVTQTIVSNSPRWEATIHEVGSLWWHTELYADDTSTGGVGGADVLLGYDGRDTAFGGPGADVMNGDGDGVEETFDPVTLEFTHITDIDPATVDEDFLFGGDDGDAIWGGRGNDVSYGGWGDDYLDVRPRDAGNNGKKGGQYAEFGRDRPAWFTYAYPENFQDVDFMYGGWDRDAMQADQAENGPDDGDRMADWAGGLNVFYVCPSGYGDFNITRSGAPQIREFLQNLAEAGGAYDTMTDGSSGFRDVAYVFTNQRGANSHEPHPDHAAHFTCANYGNVVP